MAAKASYVEKVGSVYYVRKRIPRAGSRTFGEGTLRMSLRTSDRPTAVRLAWLRGAGCDWRSAMCPLVVLNGETVAREIARQEYVVMALPIVDVDGWLRSRRG